MHQVRLGSILNWVSAAELARFENEQFIREQAIEDALPESKKRGRPKKSLLVKKALGSSTETDREDELQSLTSPPRTGPQWKRGRPRKHSKQVKSTEPFSSSRPSATSRDSTAVTASEVAPPLGKRRHGKGTELMSLPPVKKRVRKSVSLSVNSPSELRQMPVPTVSRAAVRYEIPSTGESSSAQERLEGSSDELQLLSNQFESCQSSKIHHVTLPQSSPRLHNDVQPAKSVHSTSTSSTQSASEESSDPVQKPRVRLQSRSHHEPIVAEPTDSSDSMPRSPLRFQRPPPSKEPIIEARKTKTKLNNESSNLMLNTPARYQRMPLRLSPQSQRASQGVQGKMAARDHERHPEVEHRRAPIIQLDSEESTDSSDETDVDESMLAPDPPSAFTSQQQERNPFQAYTSNALPLHPDPESEPEVDFPRRNTSSSSKNPLSGGRAPSSANFSTQSGPKASTPKGNRKSMTPLLPHSAILLDSEINHS